jgi:hypothetical protein
MTRSLAFVRLMMEHMYCTIKYVFDLGVENGGLPSFLSSGGTQGGSRTSKKLLFSLIGARDPKLSTVELDGADGSLAITDVSAVPGPEAAPVKGVALV